LSPTPAHNIKPTKMKTTTKTRPALIFRIAGEWRCETPGIGHHAGSDTAHFGTLREAKAYARSKGYPARRCPNCDD
jgi:hypothetical protein